METLDNKHYISVPRWEFEEMEKLANSKREATVNFMLLKSSSLNYGYGRCLDSIYECSISYGMLSDGTDVKKIKEVARMINKAISELNESKYAEIQEYIEEINDYKSSIDAYKIVCSLCIFSLIMVTIAFFITK